MPAGRGASRTPGLTSISGASYDKAMFGTVMRARVKPGERENFIRQMREIDQSRRPEGMESFEVAWEDQDPNRLVMIVHFRDRESYMANAATPEQDREYREMLRHLDGEPEWIDVRFQDQ